MVKLDRALKTASAIITLSTCQLNHTQSYAFSKLQNWSPFSQLWSHIKDVDIVWHYQCDVFDVCTHGN